MPDALSPAPDVEGWRSGRGFLLATIGSAVGIGSIWKFPYEVGANGGGAFVLVYLAGLALVVVPLMVAEFAIGRRGRGDAASSLGVVAAEVGRSARWTWIGLLGAATAFVILSFYAVIGGWTIHYTVTTVAQGLNGASAADAQGAFDELLADPARMAAFLFLFLAMVAAIVLRGVQQGIERAMKVLMPLLAVLLVALAVYSMAAGDASAALRFLFVPDFGQLTGRAVLDALGLGFFSIGVGLGLLITYAAYSPADVALRRAAIFSVGADTAISIVAGLAVFPVVFANGLDPAEGPGLVFVSLPVAFAAMPGGRFAAIAFFALLIIAALGSAVSMLEGVVAVADRRLGWPRRRSTAVATGACFVAGLGTVWSFNRWAGVHPLGFLDRYRTATVFDLLDEATSNLLLPLGGLGLAVLCGWVLPARFLGDELALSGWQLAGLRFLLRVAAPISIVAASVAALTS